MMNSSVSATTQAVLGLSLLAVIGGILHQRRRVKQVEIAPPGSLGLWGLGEMIEYIKSPIKFDLRRMKEYGLNYTSHLYFFTVVRIGTVVDRATYFRSEARGESVGYWPSHIQQMMGKNAASVVTGDRHKFLRKFFQAALNSESTRSYTDTIDEAICAYLNRLVDGDVHSTARFKDLSLEILIRTAFGGNTSDAEIKHFTELFTRWEGGLDSLVPFDLPFTNFRTAMRSRERIVEDISAIMARCDPNSGENDMLTRFVKYRDENGKGFTPEEIVDNVFLLWFAGTETTASMWGTLVSLLFKPENKHILAKLREEVKDITNLDDLKNAPYLSCVIDEALRVENPANGTFRMATKDIKLSDGYVVPKGTKMSAYLTAGHFDTTVWGTDEFDPDRLMKTKKERPEVMRSHFYPFGGGNRVCVGELLARLVMRVFIYRVAKHYTLDLVSTVHKKFAINRLVSTFRIVPYLAPPQSTEHDAKLKKAKEPCTNCTIKVEQKVAEFASFAK
jgi:cytochrome P450